jgi:hypothetical protein
MLVSGLLWVCIVSGLRESVTGQWWSLERVNNGYIVVVI